MIFVIVFLSYEYTTIRAVFQVVFLFPEFFRNFPKFSKKLKKALDKMKKTVYTESVNPKTAGFKEKDGNAVLPR